MAIRIFTLFLLGTVLLGRFANAQQLDGAWQLVSGEYLDNQGKLISYAKADMQSLKIISGHHFSFTSMKDNQFWAAGSGTFEMKDGQYIETLLLNSFGEQSGAQFSFKARLEGDAWYNSRWKDGVRVEYEVWQRIK